MAQQTMYAIQYLGAIRVAKNTQYTTASILALYPNTTVAKLTTDIHGDDVAISINGSPMAHFLDGDEQFIVTGHTFEFAKDCSVKLGIYKAVI